MPSTKKNSPKRTQSGLGRLSFRKSPQREQNKEETPEYRNGYHETGVLDQKDFEELDPTQSDEIQRMAEIYRLISEVNESGTKIDIPIFVLVGAQSAGKSTVVNRILRFPASFAQDGTGTRCPTMYIVEQSSEIHAKIVVEFEGATLGSWHELHGRVRSHMEKLKNSNSFSSEPIHVRVVSPHVSNFVIVDLPGLIRTENEEREAIDNMVKKYLLETLPIQEHSLMGDELPYKAIPIVIRSCKTIEEDDTFARIDKLIGETRPHWKDEPTTLCVCNKFDESCNFGSADDFNDALERMFRACGSVVPIFTNLRPPYDDGDRRVPAGHELQANPQRHLEYLQNVPRLEKIWFDGIFGGYSESTGKNALKRKLSQVLRGQCTSKVLEQKYTLSMQKIVQGSASRVVRSLENREKEMIAEIGRLNTAIQNSDPRKFRQLKEVLLTKFLQHIVVLRKNGKPLLADFCKMSYAEEWGRLRNHLENTQGQEFLDFLRYFTLEPDDLRKLYSEENHANELRDLDCELAGVAQFDRLFVAWKAMVSCMTTEKLQWEQKRNMKGGHDSAMHGDFQDQMRNILAHMLEQMQFAVIFLAESIRLHFHHMATQVARFIAQREYGAVSDDRKMREDDGSEDGESCELVAVQFLSSIRDDYKSVIDRLIDRFILTYATDSKLKVVDNELLPFIFSLVQKMRVAYTRNVKTVVEFNRAQVNDLEHGDIVAPESPDFKVPIDGQDAEDPDPGSEDEKEEYAVSATESDGGNPVKEVALGFADDWMTTALPGIGRHIMPAVTEAFSDGFKNVLTAWKTLNKKIRLGGEVRYVDLFNASMQKVTQVNIIDNEDQASACAAIHRQIYLFILIHNVKQRVSRLNDVVKRTDVEGYISNTMRNGLCQSDCEDAISQLQYSHDFGEDGVQKLREFLKQFERREQRMISLSDDDIRKRYARGTDRLREKKDSAVQEKAEFLERKRQILKKLKEAGLLPEQNLVDDDWERRSDRHRSESFASRSFATEY